jgi:hypothetical protein
MQTVDLVGVFAGLFIGFPVASAVFPREYKIKISSLETDF